MYRVTACFVLFTSFAVSQSAPAKLSDNYGKSAFLALKAIERDQTTNGLDTTSQAIANADAEAQSDSEKTVTTALNHISVDHLINNAERELLLAHYMSEVRQGKNPPPPTDDPKLKAINEREWNCFRPFEDVLRSRSSTIPSECKSLLPKQGS